MSNKKEICRAFIHSSDGCVVEKCPGKRSQGFDEEAGRRRAEPQKQSVEVSAAALTQRGLSVTRFHQHGYQPITCQHGHTGRSRPVASVGQSRAALSDLGTSPSAFKRA